MGRMTLQGKASYFECIYVLLTLQAKQVAVRVAAWQWKFSALGFFSIDRSLIFKVNSNTDGEAMINWTEMCLWLNISRFLQSSYLTSYLRSN